MKDENYVQQLQCILLVAVSEKSFSESPKSDTPYPDDYESVWFGMISNGVTILMDTIFTPLIRHISKQYVRQFI